MQILIFTLLQNLYMAAEYLPQLQKIAAFYKTGETASYHFRKKQLLLLKQALKKYENELHEALYTDLKKSAEESWITETGLVTAALSHSLKNLESWMKPEKVGTNLLNLPSRSYIYKEPLGVVLIIGPWNYPLQLLFMPLAGAMAAGNCAVLKPSEFAPAVSEVMKKIIEENFSPEYILFIEGAGEKVVPSLMQSFSFNHVFYTGSTYVGKLVYKMAAENLTPVTLELGGKSPCVVESDANIEVAARRIAVAKFSNAGQMCVAPDYVLAHHSIKEKLVAELIKNIKQWYSDDPASSYHYGKIINEKQFQRVINYLEHGKVIYGGRHDNTRHYIEPTIMEDVSIEQGVMEEEIFGPVLPIISFSDFAEAKLIIDKNPDPLAFYVFTESSEKEKQWLKIHFGGGCVNNVSWHLTNFNLPFGGRGNSGIGAYHGKFSFDLFSHSKAVMKTPTWFDPSVKFPPFKGKLNFFKKIIR
jgi:aldehyde dehydrogenase (NAD+)